MTSETTTSARGASCRLQALVRTRGVVRIGMRLAPLFLAFVWAIVAYAATPSPVQAQESAEGDVLSYVESQFGGYGLRQASAVAVSPDDAHVYVASEEDDAVVHFTRDATTGDLTYVATYVDGENNVVGLNNPVDLALDADGANLYVVGKQDESVVVFTVDGTSGALTWLETQINNTGDVEEMEDPDAVSVSPDGANVYVASDTSLTVFSRSGSDGSLQFVEAEQGTGSVTSFQLRDVVVSPDNNSVYVTSYLENAVAVLARDTGDMGKVEVTQVLTNGVSGVTGLSLVEKLSIDPDGNNVYATGALSVTQPLSGTVVVFSRDDTTGALTHVETLVNGASGVDGISGARSIETDLQNVYVAGANGDSVAVFNRAGDGTLTYASCLTANASGSSCEKNTPGLVDPSGIALSGDGTNVYVTGKESDSLVVFERNTGSGALTFQDVLFNSDGGVLGLGGADDAAVSPDGRHVYVSAERDNSVVVFERGEMGALQFVEKQTEGQDGVQGLLDASSVAVSPDPGENVYVTGYEGGTLVVFARDVTTGTLTYVETKQQGVGGIDGLAGAWSVTVSPDGENVYATGSLDNAVAVFSRDAATGALSQIQVQIEGSDGVTGLAGASGIVVSPDGEHVYVTGTNDDAVAAFRRDGPDGELSFIAAYSDRPGLNGAIDLDISADGENVYVASVIDGAVAALSRNPETGELSYTGAFMGAEEDPPSAEAADSDALLTLYWAVATSPDGKYVYAASWDITTSIVDPNGSVIVFARDPGSGLLSKVQTLRNDEGDVRGLRSPTSVTVSPEGGNVYATSVRDSAALVFRVTGSAEYVDLSFLPYVSRD